MPSEEEGDLLMMCILDVLRHDIEDLASLVRMLNLGDPIGWRDLWQRDISSDEAARSVCRLHEQRAIRLLALDESRDELVSVEEDRLTPEAAMRFWFELTEHGRRLWDAWVPPGVP